MVDVATDKRGTGRTLAWVKGLDATKPKILVVHTNAMATHLRQMLTDVRPDCAHWRIIVFSRERDIDRLRGGVPFEVDHAVWQDDLLKPELKQLLRAQQAENDRPVHVVSASRPKLKT